MFTLIEANQYRTVDHFFRSINHNLVIDAIITGHPAGRIWVDDRLNPSTALIWDLIDDFLFVGGEEASSVTAINLRKTITDVIIPKGFQRGSSTFVIHFSSEAWAEQLPIVFEGMEVSLKKKILYTLDGHHDDRQQHRRLVVPEGFLICKIDSDLMRSDLDNLDDLIACTKTIWGDIERFDKDAVGFCALYKCQMVSRCVTDFVKGRECELYVETDERFGNRGLAKAVTSTIAEYLTDRGFRMIWQCWEDNLASRRVAEAVGFKRKKLFSAYMIEYS